MGRFVAKAGLVVKWLPFGFAHTTQGELVRLAFGAGSSS